MSKEDGTMWRERRLIEHRNPYRQSVFAVHDVIMDPLGFDTLITDASTAWSRKDAEEILEAFKKPIFGWVEDSDATCDAGEGGWTYNTQGIYEEEKLYHE